LILLGQEITAGRKWWNWKKTKPRMVLNIDRPEEPKCYNTYFRVVVRNLPPKVDCFQLRQFFRKHGKVYNAEVMYKRKNKMSKRIGFVTMAMVEERADALAALDGLVSAIHHMCTKHIQVCLCMVVGFLKCVTRFDGCHFLMHAGF
jgi:hypothetical protein